MAYTIIKSPAGGWVALMLVEATSCWRRKKHANRRREDTLNVHRYKTGFSVDMYSHWAVSDTCCWTKWCPNCCSSQREGSWFESQLDWRSFCVDLTCSPCSPFLWVPEFPHWNARVSRTLVLEEKSFLGPCPIFVVSVSTYLSICAPKFMDSHTRLVWCSSFDDPLALIPNLVLLLHSWGFLWSMLLWYWAQVWINWM